MIKLKELRKYLFGTVGVCLMALALYGNVNAAESGLSTSDYGQLSSGIIKVSDYPEDDNDEDDDELINQRDIPSGKRDVIELETPEITEPEVELVPSDAIKSLISKYDMFDAYEMVVKLEDQYPKGVIHQVFYLDAKQQGKAYEVVLKGKNIKTGKNYKFLIYNEKTKKWSIDNSVTVKISSKKATFKVKGKKTCPAAICELSSNAKMTLNGSNITLQKGKTAKTIKASLSNDSISKVTSSDKTKKVIASAKANGKTIVIKAGKKAGKATVTVTTKSGISKQIKVTVQSKKVTTTDIKVTKLAVELEKKGKKGTITATSTPDKLSTGEDIKIKPKTAKDKKIATASIDAKTGKITFTAVKKGTAKYIISAGKISKIISVKVKG